jgi:hypothetical protein
MSLACILSTTLCELHNAAKYTYTQIPVYLTGRDGRIRKAVYTNFDRILRRSQCILRTDVTFHDGYSLILRCSGQVYAGTFNLLL